MVLPALLTAAAEAERHATGAVSRTAEVAAERRLGVAGLCGAGELQRLLSVARAAALDASEGVRCE